MSEPTDTPKPDHDLAKWCAGNSIDGGDLGGHWLSNLARAYLASQAECGRLRGCLFDAELHATHAPLDLVRDMVKGACRRGAVRLLSAPGDSQ